jgi:hypothetical protein
MNPGDSRLDDVDELFQSLERIAPPVHFRQSILARIQAERQRELIRRRLVALDAAIVVAFGAAADNLAQHIHWEAIFRQPQISTGALTDSVALPPLVAVVACAALAAVVTRRVRRLSRGPDLLV